MRSVHHFTSFTVAHHYNTWLIAEAHVYRKQALVSSFKLQKVTNMAPLQAHEVN